MIVVDTNVIAYLLIRGERTSAAESAFRADPDWAAPLLWRSELRDVLVQYVRHRAMPETEALRIMEDAEQALAGREYTVESHAVIRLASESGCSAYDCEYVALAIDLSVPLLTCDERVLSAFPAQTRALG